MAETELKDLWEPEHLFDEFPSATYEQWRKAAEESLKGAPFEKRLVTPTYEGVDLMPIYGPGDKEKPSPVPRPGVFPFLRGTRATGYLEEPWTVAQQTVEPTPGRANQVLAHDIARGQTGINLVLDRPTKNLTDADHATGGVGEGGLSLCTGEDAWVLLNGLPADLPLFVNTGAVSLPVLALLAAGREEGGAETPMTGCVGADPLGELAATGSLTVSLSAAYDSMAASVAFAEKFAPGLRTVLVSAVPFHDAGASAVQELAFALATAVEYARALEERGLDADRVFSRVQLAFSVGRHFFMEIAKLRAARILFAQAARAFGASDEAAKANIHGRTSSWTKTAFDPYTNMLRNTTEAFAAAMGGVDSLHVAFFDEAVRHPSEFSRRVARNVQIVLQAEARFTRPVDPAGGSWCVETLTNEVAEKAWALFQKIEKAGGMKKALYAQIPQKACAATAAKRKANLGKRKDVFVGVNMYPNLLERSLVDKWPDYTSVASERMIEVAERRGGAGASSTKAALADLVAARAAGNATAVAEKVLEAARAGATLGALGGAMAAGGRGLPSILELDIHRGAALFEDLRKNADRIQAQTGRRPRAFLANMGPLAQHKPRADFSTGYFEAGGFHVIISPGFATPAEAAEAAVDERAAIVVICGTDKAYPEIVPELAAALKRRNPDMTVLLAGRPAPDLEAGYREAGMDDFIYLGQDVHAMLAALQKKAE